MTTKDKQTITAGDVGTVDSILNTKATASVSKTVQEDLKRADSSLKDILDKQDAKDETND